ncbi:hypothetical protein AA15973_1783 [Komagataeibacter sucrofermentans DSM 15973]|nr:hypothetical protein AA15973_1783 [Komagataeibacter sucrofermentans DSM 15973]
MIMADRIPMQERIRTATLALADSRHNPGNFANERKKAPEAGHKGGQYGHDHDKS